VKLRKINVTKIIAEIGWNHMGDINLAKKMITQAKVHGADMVKTQFFSTKNLKKGPWDNDGRKEIYEKAQLTLEKYKILKEFSKKKKIKFFTSVFTESDALKISKIDNSIIKIPSVEARNKNLLKLSNKRFKKILVSTGTLTKNEIVNVVKLIDKNKLHLLHCVSSYPCNLENSNLLKIKFLNKFCKNVGFSDHSIGVDVSILSLSFNLTYLEKHFTIDNKLPGRDNKFAILPEDLSRLKKFIDLKKSVEKDKGINFQKCEKETREVYYRRWG
jgi:sialic acid synthase SpsE